MLSRCEIPGRPIGALNHSDPCRSYSSGFVILQRKWEIHGFGSERKGALRLEHSGIGAAVLQVQEIFISGLRDFGDRPV